MEANANAAAAPNPGAFSTTFPSIISKFTSLFEGHMTIFLITVFAGISVAFVVGMTFYYMLYKGVIGRRNAFPLEGTKTPLRGNEVTEVKATKGMASNPDAVSMSFWIYVNSFNKWNNNFRHVFHRGVQKTDGYLVGPLVYLDKTSNKIHISFRPEDPSRIPSFASEKTALMTDQKKLEYARSRFGMTIDYVPAQRWVHVLVTADKKNNMIKAYLDGEEVKTVNGSTPSAMKDPDNNSKNVRLNLKDVDLNGTGNFYVGGSTSSNTGIGFYGLVGNIRFFDYVLNKKEVYDEYLKGPMENVLAKMGLPVYGVRSPIYQIGTTQ